MLEYLRILPKAKDSISYFYIECTIVMQKL